MFGSVATVDVVDQIIVYFREKRSLIQQDVHAGDHANHLVCLEDGHVAESLFDHHRRYIVVGATATLIGEQYFARSVTPTLAMAGVMVAAILSDTVLFRSPTTSEKDHEVATRLQALASVDLHVFGQQLRQIKTIAIEAKSAIKIVRDDFKEFQFDGHRVGIAQVEVLRPDALANRTQDILREMHAVREAQGLAQVMLMITDVEAEASDLWVVGDRVDLFERAFGPAENGGVHLPGCMSRKKQVVPRIEAVFAAEGQPRQEPTNPR